MTTDLIDITVDVTEDDIRHGERDECRRCPIALAIARVTGKAVLVDGDDFCFASVLVDYTLPAAARDFIHLFDTGFNVSSFYFTISVPASYLEFSPCNSAGYGR